MSLDHRAALGLSPHERLLAGCVSAAATGRPLRTETQDVDWPTFVTACVRHGVAQPVANMLLQEPSTRTVSAAVQSTLSRLLDGNRRRNLTMYRELARLLNALESNGIESLVLKGVALSLTVYADFALRNFADLDILVRSSDLQRAHTIVIECGWRLQDEQVEPDHHHVIYERYVPEDILSDTVAPEFDPSLTSARLASHLNRIRLEVHQTPFFDISGAATPTDLAPFWEHSRTVSFPDGSSFLAPGPEVMLVHLCFHAASHGFQKAQFFLDTALLLRRDLDRMNPSRLERLSDLYGARRQVTKMLHFLTSEVGVSEAAHLSGVLKVQSTPPLTWMSIFASMSGGRSETRLHHWMGAGTAADRVRGALRTLAPSPVAMRRIYGVSHPVLLLSLYIWRPFQLTGRLLKIVARAALRSSHTH